MTSPNEMLDETIQTTTSLVPSMMAVAAQTLPPAAKAPAPRRRWLWPIFAVLIAGLIVAIVVTLRANSPTADATSASFCRDLTSQNYRAAYNLFSANLRSQITSEQFAEGARGLDASEGKVLRCAQDQIRTSTGPNVATPTLALTRQKLGRQSGTLLLISEQGAWRVAAVDTRLFALDPLLSSLRFGRDVSGANYADSFGLLSTHFATGTNLIGWQSVLDGTYNGIKWLHLNPDASTYQATATTASVRALATVEQVATGKQKLATITLTLVPQGADWRIDNIESTASTSR